jgi:hypothetical protein
MIDCSGCGAPVESPEDLTAISVKCRFCGRETALPKHIVKERKEQLRRQLEEEKEARKEEASRRQEERAEEHARRIERHAWRSARWSMLFGFGLTALIIGFTFWRTGVDVGSILNLFSSDDQERPTAAVSPPSTGGGEAAAKKPHSAAAGPGNPRELLLADRMRQATKKGCKRVTLPPTRRTGTAQLQADLVRGPCLKLLAVADREDETLSFSVLDPLAAIVLKTDERGELGKDFCPRMAGPHTINVVPSGGGSFTIGAVDCPKR